MNLPLPPALRRAALTLAILAPLLPAPTKAEAFLEDPFGLIGVAPTDAGGKTATMGLGFTRTRNEGNRNLYGGAVEAEAGLVQGLDLRFAQTMEYGPTAPYPSDDAAKIWGGLTRLACAGNFWKKTAGARRLVFSARYAPPMARPAAHRKAARLLAC